MYSSPTREEVRAEEDARKALTLAELPLIRALKDEDYRAVCSAAAADMRAMGRTPRWSAPGVPWRAWGQMVAAVEEDTFRAALSRWRDRRGEFAGRA
jgi:hypothetical protein